uniref:Uncharacterized protein n=1 Tax=Glossina austeni TaxID=7395 RepID=A0A1A9VRI7_GLOAU
MVNSIRDRLLSLPTSGPQSNSLCSLTGVGGVGSVGTGSGSNNNQTSLLRSRGSGAGAGFDHTNIMMKSLYEVQHHQHQPVLLATQPSLHGLLSPPSSNCTSTSAVQCVNANSNSNYPLAMECDPPLQQQQAQQQMPPPPPPVMISNHASLTARFGVCSGDTSGSSSGSLISSTSRLSSNCGSSSRLRQTNVFTGGLNMHQQQKPHHTHQSSGGPVSSLLSSNQQLPHQQNYAPASLPLDLVNHPLTTAASHLMITDSSLNTALLKYSLVNTYLCQGCITTGRSETRMLYVNVQPASPNTLVCKETSITVHEFLMCFKNLLQLAILTFSRLPSPEITSYNIDLLPANTRKPFESHVRKSLLAKQHTCLNQWCSDFKSINEGYLKLIFGEENKGLEYPQIIFN